MAKRPTSRIGQMVLNSVPALRSRLDAFLGYSHGGNRDTYTVFGWPRDLTVDDLIAQYSRNPVASRIVRAYPQATWRDLPGISDADGSSPDPDSDDHSPFSQAVADFFESYNVLRYIERADRLAGMTRYGILLFGFGDTDDLSKPLAPGNHKLLYLQPYSEKSATITKWDTNRKSPRFGKPEIYNVVQGTDPNSAGTSSQILSFRVHHSRVIHFAEFLEENEVYGVPRLHSVYNTLLDLEKVVGGSAETFWLCANRGIHFSIDPEANIDEAGVKNLKDQADELTHNLRRYVVSQGITSTVLGSESPDPGPNAEKLLDMASSGSGVPKRILLGSERGELASSQDENNWNMRVTERRKNYGTPAVLRPVIELLVATGNITPPNGKWSVIWPEGDSLGPLVEADVNLKKAQTLQTYVNSPGAELLIGPSRFCQEFLGTEAEEGADAAFEEDKELMADLPEVDEFGNPVDDEGQTPDGKEDPADDKDQEAKKVPPGEGKGNSLSVNSTPKSLYVSRKVLNGKAIVDWALRNGLDKAKLLKASDLHVTIMYCQQKVDWMSISPSWSEEDDGSRLIPPGGPRDTSILGDEACVIEFRDANLEYRHQEMLMAGCNHSYPTFKPHITFGYGLKIPSGIEPYVGPIVLGPEIFAEIENKD